MTMRPKILAVFLALALPLVVNAGTPPLEVVVYRAGDCGSWREAVDTVKAAARELDVKVKVRVVKVRDIEEARRTKFHGSPSVVVSGIDVEGPEVAERESSFG